MIQSAPDGIIVVNKPTGWTSHDVVGKMRGIAGTRRVGHLGTLDPLATGVLPLMIGQATRLARYWEDSEKAYEAVIRFGFATTTYDSQGERTTEPVDVELKSEDLETLFRPLRGEIEQIPPPVSAKKIGGVPAYKFARKNIQVELAPVQIRIHELALKSLAGDRASIFVRCSPGTYIRSIAHDLGVALGCGAHIEELVRTGSGPFRLEDAFTLERLQGLRDEGHLEQAVLPMPKLLPHFPPVFVDELTALHIRQGRNFSASPFRVQQGTEHVKAIGPEGSVLAIGRIVLPNLYHPDVVLN
ncbi:MAG: tRNA pseudouridine55 synthase [Bryobacterales bacterium]|nr:tRNA pseudouridine55 synthase [Bryobacterales bacterium]